MKKILYSILLSACSFSVFSQELPTTPSEKVYSDLNLEINKNNNSERKALFEKYYNENSKEIQKKVYDLVSSDKYLSPDYIDSKAEEEKKLLNKENLISKFYFKQGFIEEAESRKLSNKEAEDIYNKISRAILDEKIKAVLDGKQHSGSDYSMFFDYNKLGILISSYHIISDINSCSNQNQKCLSDLINKRKNQQSKDIFENLTNKCIDDKDMGLCRRNTILSDEFQRQINFNNYLLGVSMFDYYKNSNKKEVVKINYSSTLGSDCSTNGLVDKNDKGDILICNENKWIKK